MEELKTGHCIWNKYERYGQGATFKAVFTGHDLYEVMCKVVDHVLTHIGDDSFEKPGKDWDEDELEYNFWLPKNATQEERDAMGTKLLEKVIDGNGDGCDFITLLSWGGEKLIDETPEIENEQNWG